MNIFVSALLLVLYLFGTAVPDAPKIRNKDLQLLTGAEWSGTLTYLDYRSNKRVSIPSNLKVTQSVEDKLSWSFDYQYPEEPQANSKETITLGKDGRSINGQTVIERGKLAGGTLRIVTEKPGQDNNRNALFRYTYLLNARSFSIKKEVRYEGETKLFERNEYNWKR